MNGRPARRRAPKGYALLIVLGTVVIMAGIIATVMVVSRGHMDDRGNFADRIIGQYLCETGLSVAALDRNSGYLGTNAGQRMNRDFTFAIGGMHYPVHYKAWNDNGTWTVVSWAESPLRLNVVYHMTIGGRSAFPIFIKGFGGI